MTRAVAVLACVAAAAVVVVAAGKRLGGFDAAAQRDTLQEHIEEVRDCMRKHAWDSPAEPNVKEITARMLARWPDDPRVKEIRREAADRAVAEALGRKYASDLDGALALAKLALELSPALTTAQHLLAELTQAQQDKGRPAPSGSAGAPAHDATAKPASPKAQGREPRGAQKLPSTSGGPALPPPPPPLPATGAPPPASTGPWL
jgi:serine/threonine-protein kinase